MQFEIPQHDALPAVPPSTISITPATQGKLEPLPHEESPEDNLASDHKSFHVHLPHVHLPKQMGGAIKRVKSLLSNSEDHKSLLSTFNEDRKQRKNASFQRRSAVFASLNSMIAGSGNAQNGIQLQDSFHDFEYGDQVTTILKDADIETETEVADRTVNLGSFLTNEEGNDMTKASLINGGEESSVQTSATTMSTRRRRAPPVASTKSVKTPIHHRAHKVKSSSAEDLTSLRCSKLLVEDGADSSSSFTKNASWGSSQLAPAAKCGAAMLLGDDIPSTGRRSSGSRKKTSSSSKPRRNRSLEELNTCRADTLLQNESATEGAEKPKSSKRPCTKGSKPRKSRSLENLSLTADAPSMSGSTSMTSRPRKHSGSTSLGGSEHSVRSSRPRSSKDMSLGGSEHSVRSSRPRSSKDMSLGGSEHSVRSSRGIVQRRSFESLTSMAGGDNDNAMDITSTLCRRNMPRIGRSAPSRTKSSGASCTALDEMAARAGMRSSRPRRSAPQRPPSTSRSLVSLSSTIKSEETTDKGNASWGNAELTPAAAALLLGGSDDKDNWASMSKNWGSMSISVLDSSADSESKTKSSKRTSGSSNSKKKSKGTSSKTKKTKVSSGKKTSKPSDLSAEQAAPGDALALEGQ